MKKLIITLLLLLPIISFSAPSQGNIFRTILPETDNTYNIGSTTRMWKELYVDSINSTSTTTLNNLLVTGNAEIQGTLTVDVEFISNGNATIDGTLTVTEDTYLATTSGNVGIGTTEPGAKLQVGDTETGNNILISAGSYPRLLLKRTASGKTWTIMGDNDDMLTFTNGTKRMLIGDSGNIGIGGAIINDTTFAGASMVIKDGNIGIGTTSPSGLLHIESGSPYLHIFDTGTPTQGWRIENKESLLRFVTLNSVGGAQTSPMAIQYDGNIGIGTTSPDVKLHVYGGASGGTSYEPQGITIEDDGRGILQFLTPNDKDQYVMFGDNNSANIGWVGYNHATDLMSFRAGGTSVMNIINGNVGIGTTAPGAKLEVKTSGTLDAIDIHKHSTVNRAYLSFSEAGGTNTWRLGQLDYTDGLALYKGNDDPVSPGTAVMKWNIDGNVGIGTTAPGAKLDVAGGSIYAKEVTGNAKGSELRLGNADHSAGLLGYHSSSGNTQLIFKTENYAGDGYQERARIDQNGNVGIGTTEPGSILHSYKGTSGGTPHASSLLTLEDDAKVVLQILTPNIQNPAIYFGDPENNLIGQIQYAHADDSMRLFTNGSEKLTILSSGNIGIGTTEPTGKLQVSSGSSGITYSNSYDDLIVEGSGSYVGITIGTPDSGVGALNFANPSDYISASISWDYTNTLFNIGTFSPGGKVRFLSANGVEAMRIDSSGNIGIGTTSPTHKLEVLGSTHLAVAGGSNQLTLERTSSNTGKWKIGVNGDGITFNENVADSDKMIITTSGNVGIGTTAPDKLLHLASADPQIQIEDTNAAADEKKWNIYPAGGQFLMRTRTDADLSGETWLQVDRTGTTVDSVSFPNGNVGIGTTAPSYELEVVGDIYSSGYVRQATIWHAYGGFEDQAETIACGTGDWNHITNSGNTLWNLDEGDGVTETDDVFTITNTGDYAGTLSLSISASNGKDFHIRVYNNTQTAVEGRPIGVSTTGAGNEMNISVPIYIEATAGDEIQFEISSTDGTDPVVDDALFIMSYLHE